ncbi:MAG TPA: DNA/RNA nuclease SfsA [Desulfobacterales bacterium]|nr:DNA/RNA nuclease SfsA [Desulfobacterales bacterium]
MSFVLGPIIKARFLERSNRFLVRCVADSLGCLSAHLPNPGRLWELLLPGATLYLNRVADSQGVRSTARKTEHTVLAVEREGRPIFLHTHATNQVARYLVERRMLPSLNSARVVQTEVTVGKSRFDFLLRENGEDLYLEVKSCTLFGNGVAMFPDAVTERGKRHLLQLAEMGRSGLPSMVLFLVHYPGVRWFMPDYHTDFDFSTTLLKIRKDVRILPAAIGWKKDLTLDEKVKVLKIPWEYLKGEVKDCGSYLLLLELKKERVIEAGSLGRIRFERGYYIYVGSAMGKLKARIARHQRKHKSSHWHIDYLTQEADNILPLPVRSSQRLECEMAQSLCSIMQQGPARFGSSDCQCVTHLFWSRENPLHAQDFHRFLQSFRMRSP